jgi:hypothetical protein
MSVRRVRGFASSMDSGSQIVSLGLIALSE